MERDAELESRNIILINMKTAHNEVESELRTTIAKLEGDIYDRNAENKHIKD